METKDGEAQHEENNYRGIRAMPFVIGNEIFEKLGSVGTSTNLLVYLATVFNTKSITATNMINIFNGTINVATFVGAFLSDTYFGRYKTLGFACVSSFLGMLVLALTAAIPELHPPKCGYGIENMNCTGASPWQMFFLISGLGFLVVGGGGIRPCNLAFGADQFNPNTPSGKGGINSFFNWYYFTYTFAVMVSVTGIVYVQSDVSWAWGLAIPAFLMFFSCFLFFAGSSIYVKVRPDGSPLTEVVRVVVAAIRKRKMELPSSSSESDPCHGLFDRLSKSSINSKLPRTHQFRCFDKAAIIAPEDRFNEDGSAASPWRLCSIQQVEVVKCLLRVMPISASCIVYNLTLVQQQTYAVFQAMQMDRGLSNSSQFKIPAASYGLLTMVALTMWIPIYDRAVVPVLRKITRKEGGVTVLQKMGIGILLAIITNVVSGLVEGRRRSLALANPSGFDAIRGSISPLSGLWLGPQLVLAGLSEAFNIIAQVEFYYKQFPENMRSIGGSLTFVGFAVSSYLSSLLISIVHKATRGTETEWLTQDLNKGKLDYLYYLLAAFQAANLVYFVVCARWYKYRGGGTGGREPIVTSQGD
ncbi:hypothetical protein SAY86_005691 [Trapa natans]|uniref:Nitrate transporter n=1 Tax=Trapa natans TaxID=22666 RepID=A0AAN7QVP8_TRANT|nr:hypothetical protein SAY86_005691 [Trapa natans]